MASHSLVVIGMGYVGIPVAAAFADVPGFQVTGVQRRSGRSGGKIDLLNSGRSPFPESEPGIADLIRSVVEKGTFRATESYEAVATADAILIDVQTPMEPADHVPRQELIRDAAASVGHAMKKGALVCIESTVAPGTTLHVVKPILEESSGLLCGRDFSLCFSYERVMPGKLLHNLREYPRIVGGYTRSCAARGVELYTHIAHAPLLTTDCLTAEVAKTVENAYRDVNIAFANEVALACESLGVDVFEVRGFVNNLPDEPREPLTNPFRNMHMPGAGVGGHCLPKDSWLLKFGIDAYGKEQVPLRVILGSRDTNDSMPRHVAELVTRGLRDAGVPPGKARVAVLGYAYLENSDDARNSPAIPLIGLLRRLGIQEIAIHDPFVRDVECPGVERDIDGVLESSDCACLMTRHGVYESLEIERVRSLMRHCVIVDGRNAFARWHGHPGVSIYTVGIGK